MATRWKLPGTDIVIDLAPDAATVFLGHLMCSKPEALGTLCPECHHVTLVRMNVHSITASGVGLLGTCTQCLHCLGYSDGHA